jgi:hypothetical protein
MIDFVFSFINFYTPNRRTAFAMSIGAGALVTLVWSETVHRSVERKFKGLEYPEITRITWMPAMIGVLERALVTTFAIWLPMALGPFMGAWIVAKAAGGWLLIPPGGEAPKFNDYKRARNSAGLMASVVSLGWAVAWGLWAPPGHR